MKKIDTFSANSLKILQKNKEEFINKYIYNLYLFKKDELIELGNKYHSLISSYIKGFDVSKMELELESNELIIFNNLKEKIKNIKNNFIKTEYSFLIKEKLNNKPYYLTGRFDAIYKEKDFYTIWDWKSLNIPKDIENDLQTVVYLYCASKIYNTNKIKIKYYSLKKDEFREADFKNETFYKEKIDKIVSKIYN